MRRLSDNLHITQITDGLLWSSDNLSSGGLSEMQISLSRYKSLDTVFSDQKYIKKQLPISQYNSLYNLLANRKSSDKLMWVYVKHANLLPEAKEVF